MLMTIANFNENQFQNYVGIPRHETNQKSRSKLTCHLFSAVLDRSLNSMERINCLNSFELMG